MSPVPSDDLVVANGMVERKRVEDKEANGKEISPVNIKKRHLRGSSLPASHLNNIAHSPKKEHFKNMEKSQVVHQTHQEVADMNIKVKEYFQNVISAEQVMLEMTERNNKLMEENKSLIEELKKFQDIHQKVVGENQKQIQNMETKSQEALMQIQEKMLLEKDSALQQLQSALLKEKEIAVNDVKEMRKEKLKDLEQKLSVASYKQEEIKNLEAKHEVALMKLQEKLLREKETAVREVQSAFTKEKEIAVNDAHAIRQEQLHHLEERLSIKEEELLRAELKLSQVEAANDMHDEKIRMEKKEQIQKAISAHRELWRQETEKEWKAERSRITDAMKEEVKSLQEQVKKEKELIDQLKTSQTSLKEENERLQEENLAAGREKVEAVSQARETALKDMQAQLEQMRDRLLKENMKNIEKYKERLAAQEDDLDKLKSEVKVCQQREKDSLSYAAMGKSDRSLVLDINKECKKTASLLGITPRTVQVFGNLHSAVKSSTSTLSTDSGRSSPKNHNTPPASRLQLITAFENLKSTNEELRKYAKRLHTNDLSHKKAAVRAKRDKDVELQKLQSTLDRDKEESIAILEDVNEEHENEMKKMLIKMKAQEELLQRQLNEKDEILAELQRNMKTWKEETTLKIAKKFDTELPRQFESSLPDPHENGYTSAGTTLLNKYSLDDSGSSHSNIMKVLRHLQEKVKQLKVENHKLKINLSNKSMETSQQSDKDEEIYKLTQRLKVVEMQLVVTEDRNRENASLLSQSTMETSKLENALTQQTKELIKMERAYSRLSKSGSVSSKS